MLDILFNIIENAIQTNIINMTVKLVDIIKPLIGSGITLYALYIAYQSLFDSQNLLIMESIKFIGKLSFLTAIALSSSWYLENIVPIVLNSGENIAKALLNSDLDNSSNLIQVMANKVELQLQALWSTVDISITSGESILNALLVLIMCFYLLITSIPFFAICILYLCYSKIAVSLSLIVGPLFIMFACFPATKGYFTSWIQSVLHYIILNLFFPIIFSLFGNILDATIFDGNIGFKTVYFSSIIFIMLSFVAVQVPTLASSISGSAGVGGILSNISGTTTYISRMIKGKNGAMKNSLNQMKPKTNNIKAG